MIALSPWLIRNGVWLSNPFFPFFGGLLGSNALVTGEGWRFSLEAGMRSIGEHPVELLLAPFTISLSAHDGDTRGLDGVVSPLMVLSLISLWVYRRHTWVILFGLFILVDFILGAIVELGSLRSYLPAALPVITMTVLGCGGVGRIFKRRFERFTVGALIGAHVLFFIVYTAERAHKLGAPAYRGDAAAYLAERLPEYPMIEVVNRSIGRSEYVYGIHLGDALFYLKPRFMTGGVEQDAQIFEWLRLASTTNVLAQEFLHRGVSHIVMNSQKMGESVTQRLPERERILWGDFLRSYLVKLHSSGPFELYRLAPMGVSTTTPSPQKK
jgi:hypothetical protein